MNQTMTWWLVAACSALALDGTAAAQQDAASETPLKTGSVFYTEALRAQAAANAAKHAWAQAIVASAEAAAAPWRAMDDAALWGLMFGPEWKRAASAPAAAWPCPACGERVGVGAWQVDALEAPWKLACPHCGAQFPTNDFAAYRASGLNAQGRFDAEQADAALLFNTAHPNPNAARHRFGVDDGTGYVDGDRHWRFVGAYLLRGQWRQAVLGGIRNLSMAACLTGDAVYARKCMILLDRVADLWPEFDFGAQGLVYGRRKGNGYVSFCHDTCYELRHMALAYDRVFDLAKEDEALIAFLSEQATQHGLANAKASFAEIQRNIETRLFRDAPAHPGKLAAPEPQTHITLAITAAVLDWPENREPVLGVLERVMAHVAAQDNLANEKGLRCYTPRSAWGVSDVLGLFEAAEPGLLARFHGQGPGLDRMYRFYVDTWCQKQFYPNNGDSGPVGGATPHYLGMYCPKPPAPGDLDTDWIYFNALPPLGRADLLWRLYEASGNAMYLKLFALEQEAIGRDLFAENPDETPERITAALGADPGPLKPRSVNLGASRLAVMHSGAGQGACSVWLDGDAWGAHGHGDALTLGLFAGGLDLLPDLGHAPLQFGGPGTAEVDWHRMTAAHNTVTVDGKNQGGGIAEMPLWADGPVFQVLRASCPRAAGAEQYERTVVCVRAPDGTFYLVDVFRVAGGRDHAYFLTGPPGRLQTRLLSMKNAGAYSHDVMMQDLLLDPDPEPGWSVTWLPKEPYPLDAAAEGPKPRLRYTGVGRDVAAGTTACWASASPAAPYAPGFLESLEGMWLPRLVIRRQTAEGALASTFAGVIEACAAAAPATVRRLPLTTADGAEFANPNVAIEVRAASGIRDLFVSMDIENPLLLAPSMATETRWHVEPARLTGDAQTCWIRLNAAGQVTRIGFDWGREIALGATCIRMTAKTSCVEVAFEGPQAEIVHGKLVDFEAISFEGRPAMVTNLLKRR